MAEIIRVNIEFTGEIDKLLRIPEKIEAPQYSILQWNIVNLDKYFYKFSILTNRFVPNSNR